MCYALGIDNLMSLQYGLWIVNSYYGMKGFRWFGESENQWTITTINLKNRLHYGTFYSSILLSFLFREDEQTSYI